MKIFFHSIFEYFQKPGLILTANIFSVNAFFIEQNEKKETYHPGPVTCGQKRTWGTTMIFPESLNLTLLANLVLSLPIVIISIWGYYRIGKATPLYFGAAYGLFFLSHGIQLFEIQQIPTLAVILLRTCGYVLVAAGLFALLREIIERTKAEAAQRASEGHLTAAFAQTAVGIVEFLPGGAICRHNRKFTEILKGERRDRLSASIWDIINPDDHLLHLRGFNAVMQGEIPEYSGEMQVTRTDRSPVWCKISLSAVKPGDGRPDYYILVLDDISDLKHAEEELSRLNAGLEERVRERTLEIGETNERLKAEINEKLLAEERLKTSLHEKEVLLREIHHRVKNNLQIITSLLFLQAEHIRDPVLVGALTDSQARVKSMALVHEKLYQSHNLSSVDFQAYLENLVANLLIAYNIDRMKVRVTISAKDLRLPLNPAISLGLMMNELISNSLKYAFPGSRTGNLVITGTGDAETIRVRVQDDGVGIPEDFDWVNAKSLGLHLVRMLSRQLKGTVVLSRNPGTEFAITLPAGKGEGAS